jgi:hypothetical protein
LPNEVSSITSRKGEDGLSLSNLKLKTSITFQDVEDTEGFSKAALKTGSCELAIASNTEEGPIRGTVAPRFEKLEGLKKQAVNPTHRIRRKVQWKVELGV